jgi:hypothetical protein
MKNEFSKLGKLTICTLLIALASACATTQSKYDREYSKVWKELIKSKAWEESLLVKNEGPAADGLYVSTENDVVVLDEPSVYSNRTDFDKKYQSLVSRAYFKIITEAEKADARITAEYTLLNKQVVSENGIKEKSLKRQKEEMARKYNAHKAMLEGLKSWNIFNENRTGDLDYFKAENREAIQEMAENNENDDRMVNFLIYKLADLYHVEEH